MKIYLLRHGESVDDIEDCYGGIADFPLTKSGRKTGLDLAEKLADSSIQLLFSSPYKRAYETALIISKNLNCDVKMIDGLRERNSYGVLSGVNKKKSKEIFSHILNKMTGKPGDYYTSELVPGAEPVDEFDNRISITFNKIIDKATDYEVIGIVTHGNVTRSIYRNILGVKGRVNLVLLATTVIQYDRGNVKILEKHGIEIID